MVSIAPCRFLTMSAVPMRGRTSSTTVVMVSCVDTTLRIPKHLAVKCLTAQ